MSRKGKHDKHSPQFAAIAVEAINQMKNDYKLFWETCMQCSGSEHKDIIFCPVTDCPIWPGRFGAPIEYVIKKNGEAFIVLFNKSNFREYGIFCPMLSFYETEANLNRLIKSWDRMKRNG